MARGRKPKEQAVVPVVVDHAKLLKEFEQEQRVQLETLYKDLAKVKYNIDESLRQIGFMDEAESLSQAAFKAGRAFGPLDQANDKLEKILDDMYNFNYDDLDHWDDIIDN